MDRKVNVLFLTLLHSEQPKLLSFGHSECNRVRVLAILSAIWLKGGNSYGQESKYLCLPLQWVF